LTQTVGSISGASLGDPRRRIELPGVLNFRDVGGYPVAGGGSVRWRTLFRSDALHRLDAAGAAALAGLGIKTVVDLRTQAEAELAPSPVGGRVIHLPLLPDFQALPAPTVPESPGSGLDLSSIYRYFVEKCGDNIGTAISELTSDDAFPALVHCSAGKDRTGVVIALILAVLGVPDEIIAADYALSATYLNPELTPAIGQLRASTGLGEELTSEVLESPPELILGTLERVTEAAGSAEGYLRAHGLTGEALTSLRAALIV
jgi:protein-tyrosine phosphatase